MRNIRDIKTVLIVGSGAREHALYWAIKRNHPERRVICTPGNGGIPTEDRRSIKDSDLLGILKLCIEENVDFVVIGPEGPLVAGLAYLLQEHGILVFGPLPKAARLEASKIFTKELCDRCDIPTAYWEQASDYESAEAIIKQWKGEVPVIKADGLCAGKGVAVEDSIEKALKAAHEMLVEKKFGEAGSRIVIEERMTGRECSAMYFCDGGNAIALPLARDYKRAYDGDKGPNTGGMGSYSPVPDVSGETHAQITEQIIMPTLNLMMRRSTQYRGLLYAGIMLTEDGPKLVEYNCRFGDPETQVILPRIESDILEYMLACAEYGGLAELGPLKVSDNAAVCFTLASAGYPGKYDAGFPICFEHAPPEGVHYFHAGTDRTPDLVTSGGRVMSVVGIGPTIEQARMRAQEGAYAVKFKGKSGRRDVALHI
jgi:phosphoribosylamine--glycine ligase